MLSSSQCRPAKPEDLDAVAYVWRESAKLADGVAPEIPSLSALRERINSELASDWSLWVATLDREVVGMLALKKSDAIVDQLFILPSAQRRGLGKLLLGQAMKEMPNGFTLRTAAANAGARAFYEKIGLKLLSVGKHPRDDYAVCFYGWKVR